jgi:hypothetical protein
MVDLHLTNVMIQSLTNQLCNNIFYSFKVIEVFLLLDDYINVVTFTIVY